MCYDIMNMYLKMFAVIENEILLGSKGSKKIKQKSRTICFLERRYKKGNFLNSSSKKCNQYMDFSIETVL